jgi:hypothetical protein
MSRSHVVRHDIDHARHSHIQKLEVDLFCSATVSVTLRAVVALGSLQPIWIGFETMRSRVSGLYFVPL